MTPTKSDEVLLSEFHRGRSAALGELAQRYERVLLGFAAGLLGGRRDLACDAIQETWLRVIRFAGGFDARSSFKTWVYRIAVNQCRTLGTTLERDNERAAPTIHNESAPPEEALSDAERNETVRRAVAQLSADQRTIVLLCYHEGLTHEQASEILELPTGTLKSRLHAALMELRALLCAEAVA